MINAVIGGISNALFAAFGERYEIFDDEIKQDLKEPCFFIACINPACRLFPGKRYFRTNNFCVHYFPETDTKKRECMDVAERMLECLEVITADGTKIRGTKMKYEVVDGVLHFFVNYDCFMYRVEQQTAVMEKVKLHTNAKG